MRGIESTDDDVETTPERSARKQKPKQKPDRLLFHNRDYTGWWIGDTVSEYGSALSTVAYPLLILAVTGSSASAGIVASAAAVGALVTMLFGGALADRVSRRTLLLVGPLIQAGVVGTVVIAVAANEVSLVYVAIAGFVQGLVGGLTGGAEFAVLRRVVPPEQLPKAFSLLQGRTMTIRLVGPSSGGVLFGLARWVPFLGDAASFLASAVGVCLIRRPLGPDPDERAANDTDDADDGDRESIVKSIAEGFRYIRTNAYLRFLTAWAAVSNGNIAGLLLLVIVLIHSRHGSAALVGAVSSTGAIGGVIGAASAARVAKRFPGRPLVIAASWLIVASTVGIALVPNPWAVGALLALIFVLISPLNVIFNTYEARMIPDALMGRVSTSITFGASTLRWVGPLAAGALASAFGPTAATLVFAGVQAAVAASTLIARGLLVLNRPIDEVTADS